MPTGAEARAGGAIETRSSSSREVSAHLHGTVDAPLRGTERRDRGIALGDEQLAAGVVHRDVDHVPVGQGGEHALVHQLA